MKIVVKYAFMILSAWSLMMLSSCGMYAGESVSIYTRIHSNYSSEDGEYWETDEIVFNKEAIKEFPEPIKAAVAMYAGMMQFSLTENEQEDVAKALGNFDNLDIASQILTSKYMPGYETYVDSIGAHGIGIDLFMRRKGREVEFKHFMGHADSGRSLVFDTFILKNNVLIYKRSSD